MSPSDVIAEQCTGRGASGVVCAAAPLAAQAGAAVLRDGGNAFDAVVAAGLAETVLLPSKCGLGGDLVAIAAVAGSDSPTSLLAIGGAPAGLGAVASRGGLTDTGPLSVGPPAAARGYAALAERGRLGLARLAAPAIGLARDGFPWAAVNHRLSLASVDLLRRWNPDGTVYLPGDRPIEPGRLVRLAGLARVLDEFAERGGDLLAGPVGAAIVAAVASRGGVLAAGDLAAARAEWAPCVSGAIDGHPLWTTPAPTHGPSLLDAAAGARRGDDPGDVYRRVLGAIATRRNTLSDPSGTSIVSAADRDGNAVVVVHSNSYPRFGSGVIVDGYDLVLANRAGRGFTADPAHPNFPVAGRRPATTLHAWALADVRGRPFLLGGTPGGENQMPWNAQLLQQVIDGERRPGHLVTSPRWEWLPADDGVRVEEGLDVGRLAGAAGRVVPTTWLGLPSAQQVVAVPVPGEAIVGAADPRTVGAALGV